MHLIFLIQETPYREAVINNGECFRKKNTSCLRKRSLGDSNAIGGGYLEKNGVLTSTCSHRPQKYLRYSKMSPTICILYPVWEYLINRDHTRPTGTSTKFSVLKWVYYDTAHTAFWWTTLHNLQFICMIVCIGILRETFGNRSRLQRINIYSRISMRFRSSSSVWVRLVHAAPAWKFMNKYPYHIF